MKVLVANRGEIALRIVKTLRRLGVGSVAVHAPDETHAPHVALADQAVLLTSPAGFLDPEALIAHALATGCDALHPGYGYLSQSPDFADRCVASGVMFLGPTGDTMRALGDKRAARALARDARIPVIAGGEQCDSWEDAQHLAAGLTFPILVKAAGGGGGKGMRRVDDLGGLGAAWTAAQSEARAAFGDARLLLEELVFPARHLEVQILGDGKDVVSLGTRECSLQRRFQKLIEEAPATSVDPKVRDALEEAARAIGERARYLGAGTVEFLVDGRGRFFFLEVNARLQVEHPVTEMVTGLDLVEWQLRAVCDHSLPAAAPCRGHSIEARINAERAYEGFLPSMGTVEALRWPQWPNVRVDSGIEVGSVVGPNYDPLLAKVIAWGADRAAATASLRLALEHTTLLGLTTNQRFLRQLLESRAFTSAQTFTHTVESTIWPEPGPTPSGSAAPLVLGSSPWNELGGFRIGSASTVRRAFQSAHAVTTRREKDDPNVERALRAPMTGKVIAVLAHEGDTVEQGTLLVRMEAMKMEYPIVAPRAGKVAAVSCRAGDQVELGTVLVELGPQT